MIYFLLLPNMAALRQGRTCWHSCRSYRLQRSVPQGTGDNVTAEGTHSGRRTLLRWKKKKSGSGSGSSSRSGSGSGSGSGSSSSSSNTFIRLINPPLNIKNSPVEKVPTGVPPVPDPMLFVRRAPLPGDSKFWTRISENQA